MKIVSNKLEPQYVGKIGKVKKVYETFTEEDDDIFLYRIDVDGITLKGVARETDLVLI